MTRENIPATKADLRELATKKELHKEIDRLAGMVADGFAGMTTKEDLKAFTTKEDLKALEQKMRAGFSLVMENTVPLRRDYEMLKDDLAPHVELLDARLTKVERKVGL